MFVCQTYFPGATTLRETVEKDSLFIFKTYGKLILLKLEFKPGNVISFENRFEATLFWALLQAYLH